MKRPSSIRTYLFFLTWLVLGPLVCGLGYIIYANWQTANRIGRENALRLAHIIASDLQREADQIRITLVEYSTRRNVLAMDPGDVPGIFLRFTNMYPHYTGLLLLNAAGQIIHAVPDRLAVSAEGWANEPWFQDLMRDNQFTSGLWCLNPASNEWVTVFAQPVPSTEGTPRGCLCALIDLECFAGVLTNVTLPPNGVITILDDGGVVAGRSIDAERWQGQNVRGLGFTDLVLSQSHGTVTARGLDGVNRLYGFAAVPGTHWRVVVGVPTAAAAKQFRLAALRSGLLAAGVLGLATGLCIWISRRVNQPIQDLVQGLGQLAQGRWDARVPARGPREILELTEVFNSLYDARQQVDTLWQAEREKFRALAENTLTGIYVIQDGRFRYVNPRMAEIFGCLPEEIVREKTVDDLTAPEDRAVVAKNIHRRLTGETTSLRFTYRGVRKDGTQIDVEVYGSRSEWEGRPAILGTLQDITERNRIEAALRESELRFRTLAERSLTGIYIIRGNRFLYANPHLAEVFGYTVEKLIQEKAVLDLVAPQERAEVAENLRQRLSGEVPIRHYSFRGLRKDGAEIEVEVYGSRMEFDGQPVVIGTLLDVTERQRAAAAVRASEERLRMALAAAHMISWERNLQTNRMTFSGDFAAFFGLPGSVLFAEPEETMRAVHPDDRAKVLATVKQAVENGRDFVAEFRGAAPVNNPQWYAFHGCVYPDAKGRPARLCGVTLNITERKQAELDLRASEEKFRTLVEEALLGIFLVDTEGRLLEANAQGCAMLGYTREELLDRSVHELVADTEHAKVEANLRLLQVGQALHFERLLKRKDGTEFPAEARAKMLSDGRVLALVADVSERKRTEAALRQAEEKYRTLVEQIPAIAYTSVLEDPCRFLFVGPQIESLGFPLSAWTEQPDLYHRVVHPADHDRVEEATRRARGAGQPFHCEYRLFDRDGRERWIRDDAMVVQQGPGQPPLLRGVMLDITESKKAEAAMREISARLLNLQEEERRHIARELHATTGQNLVALHLGLQTLKSALPNLKPPASKPLDDALALAGQCVEELRTFSYLLHPPVLDELGLCRALQEFALGFELRSGIQIELDLAPDLGRFPKETEIALFRVVQEGLGNIRRHAGSRTAAIRLWREAKELWLEVADTGQGVSPEKLQEFEAPSAQVGVGIAGMRERLRQLHGRLEIRSSPSGTTIQAIVPVADGEPDPAAEASLI